LELPLEILTALRRVGPDTPNPGMERSIPEAAPPGFTLLEIIVVLLIIGVAFVVAAPALPNHSPEPDPLQRVLEVTRRAAVHQAEALTLSVNADGDWRIDSRTSTEVAPLGFGTLPSYHEGPVIVKASALGRCTVETATSALRLDPVRCRVQAEAR
jgi:prepilin-type N-terminal cleavage/methylation domain-containing protein